MSKSKANTLAQEIQELVKIYGSQHWHLIEAMLQIIDREKIMVINRYRKNHNEPEMIPEITRYKGINNANKIEWIIDVPQEWYSLTGKDVS